MAKNWMEKEAQRDARTLQKMEKGGAELRELLKKYEYSGLDEVKTVKEWTKTDQVKFIRAMEGIGYKEETTRKLFFK